MRSFQLGALTGLVAAMLTACGGVGPPPAKEVIVREATMVLDQATRTMLSESRADGTLVFTAATGQTLPPIEVGAVIVSEPTAAAPEGLLRRATVVDADEPGVLTVQTEQATFGDALEQGSLSVEFGLDPADPDDFTPAGEGVALLLDPAGLEDGIGLTFDKILYDGDGNTGTKHDQVKALGEIRIKPVFKVDLDLDCKGFLCLDSDIDFMFQVGVEEVARVGLTGKGVLGLNIKETIPLGTFKGSPKTFFIGPVPVVITPKLVLELRFDGSVGVQVSYEVSQTLTAVAGAKYDDGWENLSDLDNEFAVGPVKTDSPISAVVNGKAKGAMRGELMFYGVVGPTLEIVPWVGLDLRYPRDPIWKLNAGLEANVGVKISVLGYSKSFNANLFDYSAEVAQSVNAAPQVSFVAGPLLVSDANFGSTLTVSVQDAEDGPETCCAVSFSSSLDSDGNDGALGSDSGTMPSVGAVFTTLGDRTVTATAVDSKGKTASATMVVRVVNTDPLVFRTMPFDGQTYFQGQAVKLRASSFDPNEPDFAIDCSAMTWTSNRAEDPFPLSGCNVATAFPTTGSRTLTLTGSDSHGASASTAVAVNVTEAPANLPPVVNVTSPGNDLGIAASQVLTLAGTVVDPEGMAVTTSWDLLGEYDPQTGTGGELYPVVLGQNGTWRLQDTVPGLGTGCGFDHFLRLRLNAVDADGQVGSDFVVLRISVIC